MAEPMVAPGARRRRVPINAFRASFLAEIDERDEPASAAEADYDGPWLVIPGEREGIAGFGVFRAWEDPGQVPPRGGWYVSRETAQIAAALLPAIGTDPWFHLALEESPAGHRLEQRGELAGFLPIHEDKLCEGLHFAECLVRSPVALAALLLGASPAALTLVGEILNRSVANRSAAGKP